MNIARLLDRLQKVKSTGNQSWVACCPAHDDHEPSLAITLKDDKVLLHCFSGCPSTDVLTAIGLRWKDLYPNSIPYTAGPARDDLLLLQRELWVVQIVLEDLGKGRRISPEDQARCAKASDAIISVLPNLRLNHEHFIRNNQR